MADEVARGQPVDLERVCRAQPDLADDLRNLWGAVLVTDAVGVSQDEVPAAEGTERWRGLELPILIGDYELLEELGRGGMGVVFRARQVSLNREVAVKMILRGRLASEADLQRFFAEATATARLEHPNIVPVYDVGDVDGRPYFSMQMIRGQTLAERLAEGPLPEREAAQLVAQAARAIGYAHRQGVLHRDVKPSNILLDEQGIPHLTDFGLAKQGANDAQLTRSGMVLGTPAYMAPEQAAGKRGTVGPASDIYALGCVLYHALTGRPPLAADSPVEMMLLILEQDPPPPRALRPQLDRDLEMIVVRCLQKPVDLRYETADELADDLEAFLKDERVSARSGRFSQVFARLFRETHHAAVLENWGRLWMWNSLVLWIVSMATWIFEYVDVNHRAVYAALWTIGTGAWGVVFWRQRRRMGPVTFVERQTAHVWAAALIAIGTLFLLEWWLSLRVLTLSPLIAVTASAAFIISAGIFSGAFYAQAVALLAAAVAMAVFPRFDLLIFGFVIAPCLFLPGLKYHRQRTLNAS
ncbi:serine/threonine-protein kinase [Candidatus Laterigemmans baculatus]|uniref:serine/threonine-protein kinase n=1 Tax=Candidatus Laterigemmans baculatus TaxID=2770505 RepID=UPI0013DC1EEF|nr:serine/threonine-protein kinase [Candidatus Laterigemmans baculatus]